MNNFPVIFGQFSTCYMDIIEQFEQLRTSFMHYCENSTYFYSGTKLFFFSQEGRYPGYRHTQRAEIHLGTLLVKGEGDTTLW